MKSPVPVPRFTRLSFWLIPEIKLFHVRLLNSFDNQVLVMTSLKTKIELQIKSSIDGKNTGNTLCIDHTIQAIFTVPIVMNSNSICTSTVCS